MVAIKSATNGNVFEVTDEQLISQLKAEGHKVLDEPKAPEAPKKSD